jgi:hypothetical protein
MTISGRPIALAVQAAISACTGRSCGYNTAPTAAAQPTSNTLPYHVLYELGQTPSGPPFGDQAADTVMLVQVTTVGATPDAASAGADKVRDMFLGRSTDKGTWRWPISVPAGLRIIHREVDREDGMTVVGSTYSYVQRFKLHVTSIG